MTIPGDGAYLPPLIALEHAHAAQAARYEALGTSLEESIKREREAMQRVYAALSETWEALRKALEGCR